MRRSKKQRRPSTVAHLDWTSISLAGGIAMAMWFAFAMGVFRSVDSLAYDSCVQLTQRIRQTSARVVLVYVDEETSADPARLAALSHKLKQLGVRSQGTAFVPPQNSAELRSLAADEQLIQPTMHPASDFDATVFASMETVAQAASPTLYVHPSERGVYRHSLTYVPSGMSSSPTLEADLARSVLLEGVKLPEGPFRINYRGGADSLPSVEARQVLADELVPEFVAGKVALIGHHSTTAAPGIATPTTTDGRLLSLLEYHGHILNTLLTETAIYDIDNATALGLLLLISTIGSILSQRLPLRHAAAVTGVSLIGVTMIMTLLITLAQMWVPIMTLTLTQVACLTVAFGLRFRISSRAVDDMANDQRRRMRRRRWPTDFFGTEESWEQLVLFAYQMFYLDRLVILELLPDNDYLQVVKQVNCDEEDISERRRDCRRWPFSGAMDMGGPFRLDDSERWFFRRTSPEHQQYLVPLQFGGELYGYLALEVATDYLAQFEDFLPRLQDFGEEVAGLLYRRRSLQGDAAKAKAGQLLGQVPEQTVLAEVQHANIMLERRLARLEEVFDNSANASAVFDVFGQPLLMNNRLLQILQKKSRVASETTAVDLLAILTGRDLNCCRRRLRQVIIEKQPTSATVSLEGISKVFTLHVRPVRIDSSVLDRTPREAEPFQLQGIHCELVDGTSFLELHTPKDRVAQHLCTALSRELSSVNQVAERLAAKMPDTEYETYGLTITDHLHDATEILRECQSFLESDIFGYPGDGVPVQAEDALRCALATCVDSMRARHLDAQVQPVGTIGEVLANPQRLQEMFEVVLETLVSTAASHSRLTIRIEQGSHRVDFVFRTETQLGKSLPFAPTPNASQEPSVDGRQDKAAEQLHELQSWAEHWGGQLTAAIANDSEEAIIRLSLHAYQLQSIAPAAPLLSSSVEAITR